MRPTGHLLSVRWTAVFHSFIGDSVFPPLYFSLIWDCARSYLESRFPLCRFAALDVCLLPLPPLDVKGLGFPIRTVVLCQGVFHLAFFVLKPRISSRFSIDPAPGFAFFSIIPLPTDYQLSCEKRSAARVTGKCPPPNSCRRCCPFSGDFFFGDAFAPSSLAFYGFFFLTWLS